MYPNRGYFDYRNWMRPSKPTGWLSRGAFQFYGLCLLLIALAMLLGISIASASPSCPTFTEARDAWPNKYLSWHGEHCWSAGHPAQHHAQAQREVPLPKSKPFILLLEQSEQPSQEWIYADRWWIS